jgi:hypothetical protein
VFDAYLQKKKLKNIKKSENNVTKKVFHHDLQIKRRMKKKNMEI